MELIDIAFMKEKDIDEVSQIEQNTFSTPWSRNSFLEAINNENTLYVVAHKDGEVAGYAGLWQSFDEGEITNVAVNPKYRRQGIGISLMKWLEQKGHERGINAFLLEVRESNDNARNLYTKIGYKTLGMRKNFYEKPVENAIIMSKIIKER
jgi:ribosomal-protein-alanine N-acetyltransferase